MTSRSSGKRGKVKVSGNAELNSGILADEFSSRFIGYVLRRTAKGIDANGKPFKEYSEKYDKLKKKSGRDSGTVDLNVTGTLLGNVTELSRVVNEDTIVISMGPAPTTRRAYYLDETGLHYGHRKKKDGKSGGKNSKPPNNNTLGWYHQTGQGNNPIREWLGLTPEEMAKIAKTLMKVGGAIKVVKD